MEKEYLNSLTCTTFIATPNTQKLTVRLYNRLYEHSRDQVYLVPSNFWDWLSFLLGNTGSLARFART